MYGVTITELIEKMKMKNVYTGDRYGQDRADPSGCEPSGTAADRIF